MYTLGNVLLSLTLSFALSLVPAAGPGIASAAEGAFPERAITVISPFSAGGGTTIELMNLAPYVQKYLGQPMVVDIKPGGGTTIGAMAAARSRPDGYTLLCASLTTCIFAQELHGTESHLEDFEYIYAWFKGPMDITVRADSQYRTFSDLLEASRNKPLKASIAGIGSQSHLMITFLEKHAGLRAVPVPYGGGGPAATALIRGDVDFYSGLSTTSLRFVRNGQSREIAILGPEPLEALPDTPTIYELGYADFPYVPLSRGVAAPPGTPADRIAVLEDAFRKAVNDPGFREIMKKQGRPVTPISRAQWRKYSQDAFQLAQDYIPLLQQAIRSR